MAKLDKNFIFDTGSFAASVLKKEKKQRADEKARQTTEMRRTAALSSDPFKETTESKNGKIFYQRKPVGPGQSSLKKSMNAYASGKERIGSKKPKNGRAHSADPSSRGIKAQFALEGSKTFQETSFMDVLQQSIRDRTSGGSSNPLSSTLPNIPRTQSAKMSRSMTQGNLPKTQMASTSSTTRLPLMSSQKMSSTMSSTKRRTRRGKISKENQDKLNNNPLQATIRESQNIAQRIHLRNGGTKASMVRFGAAEHNANIYCHCAACMQDPSKLYGTERKMNMRVNEEKFVQLQGPTGWTHSDLRTKYRDEEERELVYERAIQAREDADRALRESGIVVPVVQMERHPIYVHVDFNVRSMNAESRFTAAKRNKKIEFCLDVETIWNACRAPGGVASSKGVGRRRKSLVIKGLSKRRPVFALQEGNSQVQSVDYSRAIENQIDMSKAVKESTETEDLVFTNGPWKKGPLLFGSTYVLNGLSVEMHLFDAPLDDVDDNDQSSNNSDKLNNNKSAFDTMEPTTPSIINNTNSLLKNLSISPPPQSSSTTIKTSNSSQSSEAYKAKILAKSRAKKAQLEKQQQLRKTGGSLFQASSVSDDSYTSMESDSDSDAESTDKPNSDPSSTDQESIKSHRNHCVFSVFDPSREILFELGIPVVKLQKVVNARRTELMKSDPDTAAKLEQRSQMRRKSLMGNRLSVAEQRRVASIVGDVRKGGLDATRTESMELLKSLTIIAPKGKSPEDAPKQCNLRFDNIVGPTGTYVPMEERQHTSQKQLPKTQLIQLGDRMDQLDKVPGSSIFGRALITAGDFVKDEERSSTCSVLVTLSAILDIPFTTDIELVDERGNVVPENEKHKTLSGEVSHLLTQFVPDVLISEIDDRIAKAILYGNQFEEDEIDADIDLNVDGHRRNLVRGISKKFGNFPDGFRLFNQCYQLVPDFSLDPDSFGVRIQGVTLPSPMVWPERYTWHSDDIASAIHLFPAEMFSYILRARLDSAIPNDPGLYTFYMRYYEVLKFERTKMSDIKKKIEDERKRAEEQAEADRIEAATRAEADERRRRDMQKEQLRAQERLKNRRRAVALQGKGPGLGSRDEDWDGRKKSARLEAKDGIWERYEFLTPLPILNAGLSQDELIVLQSADPDGPKRVLAGRIERTDPLEVGGIAVDGIHFFHNSETGKWTWDQPLSWNEDRCEHMLDQRLVQAAVEEKRSREQAEEKAMDELQAKAARAKLRRQNTQEFQAKLRSWVNEHFLHGVTADAILEVMEPHDIDRNGRIPIGEFTLCLHQLGLVLTPEELDILVHAEELRPPNLNEEDEWPDEHEQVYIKNFCRHAVNPDHTWLGIPPEGPPMEEIEWTALRALSNVLRDMGSWREYEHKVHSYKFYYNYETGKTQWTIPDEVVEMDQKEMKAEAERLEYERTRPRRLEEVGDDLAKDPHFLKIIAEKLGIPMHQLQIKNDDDDDDLNNTMNTTMNSTMMNTQESVLKDMNGNPVDMNRGRAPSRGGRRGALMNTTTDLNNDEDEINDESNPVKQRGRQRANAVVASMENFPGLGWRLLKGDKVKQGLLNRVLETQVNKSDAEAMNTSCLPSLAGVMDPIDSGEYDPLPPEAEPRSRFVVDLEADAKHSFEEGDDAPPPGSKPADMIVHALTSAQDNLKPVNAAAAIQEMAMKCGTYIRSNRVDELENALDAGVSVNFQDEYGNTLLMIAAQNNNKRIVKMLLRRGCNTNLQNNNLNTCLHYAFAYGFSDLGNYLIEKGADDGLHNQDGLTCYEGLDPDALEEV